MSWHEKRQPVSVTIDGAEYPLNTHFRHCLLTVAALEDETLADWEKADILLKNMYSEPYPENVNEAIRQVIQYLMQNREPDDTVRPKLLDFEQDEMFIRDAFLSKGINLYEQDITFWEFLSHLRELPKDCALYRIVYLRGQYNRGKLTKEERGEINRIGRDIVILQEKGGEYYV